MHDDTNKTQKIQLSFILFFVVFGYMIYSPMVSNYLTNPDGICIGLVYKPWSEGGDFGRIGIQVVDLLFGKIVSPNLMLIICLFLLGSAILLLIEIFNIKMYSDMVLLGMIALLMPSTSSIFTYYYCMVSYVLAYVLAVLACYFTIRNERLWSFIIGGSMITLQLMLYQAYLSVAITISLLYLIYLLIFEQELYRIIRLTYRLILMGGAGVGIYLFLIKALKIPLSPSRGFDKMGQINIKSIPLLIANSYSAFIDYFFGNKLLNNCWLHRDWINSFICFFLIIMFIYLFLKNKIYCQIKKILLGGGMIALLPIALEIMVVVAPEVDTFGTTGILLIPAMSLLYMSVVFFHPLMRKQISCKNQLLDKIIQYSHLIVIIPVIWNLVLFTAAFENVMWLNDQSTYALCEKISERIEDCFDVYQKDVKIMIAGNPELGNYPCTYEELRDIVRGTLAEKGLVWQGGWLSNVCYQAIFKQYFNIEYQIPINDEYNAIIKSESFKTMGVFPDSDSVKCTDGLIVIKLSE